MSTDPHLQTAISDAAAFIETRRCADGLWRDFHTLAGESSDWVTGFVAYALSRSPLLSTSALSALKVLLARQRPNGGWSYNRAVPTDCDSTAWVLLAQTIAPTWRPSAVQRAMRYIKAHWKGDGFSTYCSRDRIDRFIGISDPALTQGWLAAHPCVTSVAIQSLLIHKEPIQSECIQAAIQYLINTQSNLGIWQSYWWKGYAYSTYHALKALTMAQKLQTKELQHLLQFLLSQQQEDGGWNDSNSGDSEVFATAFIVLSLLLFPDHHTLKGAEQGIAWLLQHQNSDGSWSSQPILRIPPPMVERPETVEAWRINQEGTGVMIEDPARVFTSAAAFWALSVFSSVSNDAQVGYVN